MSALRSASPKDPNADSGPPAAVEFHYTQTESFVPLLHQLGASLLVSTYQANKLLVVRSAGNGISTLVRTFDKPMGLAVDGRRLALGTRTQVWFCLLRAALLPRDRRHRGTRTGLGRRRAMDRQNSILLFVYAGPRIQFRAALATAVHHRPGRRGLLPSQRTGDRRWPAEVCHRPGRDRCPGRLAAGQGPRRLPDGYPQRRNRRPRPVDAPFAALARRPALAPGVRTP